MLIISTGEFREKQKAYLDKVDAGTQLIINRKNKSYKVVPVEDDTAMTREEFFARVAASRKEYESGRFVMFPDNEELFSFLDRL